MVNNITNKWKQRMEAVVMTNDETWNMMHISANVSSHFFIEEHFDLRKVNWNVKHEFEPKMESFNR